MTSASVPGEGRFRHLAHVGALLRMSTAEATTYRVESLVWMLATTMPLVMLALFAAVAREGPVGRFGPTAFAAYFLCTFVVRTTTGSWAAWQMNLDIRDGTLAVRLLRPAQPLLVYAADNMAAMPLRGLVCLPVAAVLLVTTGGEGLTHDLRLVALGLVAMVGAWLSNLFVNLTIGCLAFFVDSSVKVMDLYAAVFFLASGYLVPLEIFPPGARSVLEHLPFHFQLGLPVEIFTGAHSLRGALFFLVEQWLYVAVLAGVTRTLWRRGVARFAAYGG